MNKAASGPAGMTARREPATRFRNEKRSACPATQVISQITAAISTRNPQAQMSHLHRMTASGQAQGSAESAIWVEALKG